MAPPRIRAAHCCTNCAAGLRPGSTGAVTCPACGWTRRAPVRCEWTGGVRDADQLRLAAERRATAAARETRAVSYRHPCPRCGHSCNNALCGRCAQKDREAVSVAARRRERAQLRCQGSPTAAAT